MKKFCLCNKKACGTLCPNNECFHTSQRKYKKYKFKLFRKWVKGVTCSGEEVLLEKE